MIPQAGGSGVASSLWSSDSFLKCSSMQPGCFFFLLDSRFFSLTPTVFFGRGNIHNIQHILCTANFMLESSRAKENTAIFLSLPSSAACCLALLSPHIAGKLEGLFPPFKDSCVYRESGVHSNTADRRRQHWAFQRYKSVKNGWMTRENGQSGTPQRANPVRQRQGALGHAGTLRRPAETESSADVMMFQLGEYVTNRHWTQRWVEQCQGLGHLSRWVKCAVTHCMHALIK